MADRAAMALEAHRAQEESGGEPGLEYEEEAGATWLSSPQGGGATSPEPPQGEFRDDVTGHPLPSGLTREAREEELKFLREWHVWDVRPTAECWAQTGKPPIGGRWVDHNKGDEDHPKVRSRYVAKDIARWKDDAMLAATPPLEAVRLLLSEMATRRRAAPGEPGCGAAPGRKKGQKKAMVIDVSKAHLHAFVNSEIYVALPPGGRRAGHVRQARAPALRHERRAGPMGGLVHADPEGHGVRVWPRQRVLLLAPEPEHPVRGPW